jgi:hypothetical protein
VAFCYYIASWQELNVLILLNAVLGWIANFYQIWIWATARQYLTPKLRQPIALHSSFLQT